MPNTIPNKIVFVYNNDSKKRHGAILAFPAIPDNKGRMETARSWAQYLNKDGKIVEEEIDNIVTSVRLISIERRGEGRAWKIIVNEKFLIDMREYPLFDSLLLDGCKKEGVLNGEFVFLVSEGQLLIVNKNSDLYKKSSLKDDNCSKFSKIDKKDSFFLWETKKEIKLVLFFKKMKKETHDWWKNTVKEDEKGYFVVLDVYIPNYYYISKEDGKETYPKREFGQKRVYDFGFDGEEFILEDKCCISGDGGARQYANNLFNMQTSITDGIKLGGVNKDSVFKYLSRYEENLKIKEAKSTSPSWHNFDNRDEKNQNKARVYVNNCLAIINVLKNEYGF